MAVYQESCQNLVIHSDFLASASDCASGYNDGHGKVRAFRREKIPVRILARMLRMRSGYAENTDQLSLTELNQIVGKIPEGGSIVDPAFLQINPPCSLGDSTTYI